MTDIHPEREKAGLIGRPVTHSGVIVALGVVASDAVFQPFRLETISHDGAYAISCGIDMSASADHTETVIVDIEVETGAIGVGCMRLDFSEFVDVEQVVSTGPRRKIHVAMGAADSPKQLMFRNASHDGPSVARVYGIDVPQRELDGDSLFSDLDELGQATAMGSPLPFLFCVVSWGCAATQWLATTLNAHPDIFCVHCENQFWQRLGGARNLDGWQYLRILGCESPVSRACGDVHGVSRESIPDLRAKLGEKFNCTVLVREPLPRLRSQMALFETWPVKSAWNVAYVGKFIDRGVRVPNDTLTSRFFLHGVNMLNNIVHEVPIASVWRSEDLTTDATSLTVFIDELTRGHVEVDPGWAEHAVHRPASNRHHGQTVQSHQFESWQIEAIREIVEPEAWQMYEKLGYKTPDFIG